MDMGILEACGIVAAISAGLGGPIAVVKWVGGYVTTEIEEAQKALRLEFQPTVHKLNNVATRVDAIERLRVVDVERIVKLETNLTNLEKGQLRIEHQLEKMDTDNEKGRAEIIETLRELRTVQPRS